MRGSTVLVACGAALLAGGCFASLDDGTCRADVDCNGATCPRVGECATDTYALRIEWTVHGLTTDQAGACDGVAELEVAIEDPSTGAEHAVRPVPCSVGSFFYDKLPLGYTDVTLAAYGAGDSFLDSARGSALGSGGVVRLALLP